MTVDFCVGCQGIWNDRDELEELVGEHLDPAIFPLPFATEVVSGPPCPACRDAAMAPRQVFTEDGLELFDCFRCGGIWLDGGVLPKLRAELRQRAGRRRRFVPLARHRTQQWLEQFRFKKRLPFDVPIINAVALPAAFLVALVLNVSGAKVLLYPFQIVVHELGHAVTAWLSGRLAVPLPMAVTFWSAPMFPVPLFMLALLGAFAYLSWKERRFFAMVTAGLLMVFQVYLSWVVSDDTSEMWAIFGGIGGELLISAFFIVAFYYPAPEKLRWDFWRYVVLIPAACAFTLQALLWYQVGQDMTLMPLGSALAGTRDGSGDLEKLINLWGWTKPQIVNAYQEVALICGFLFVWHYFYFLWTAWLQTRQVRAAET